MTRPRPPDPEGYRRRVRNWIGCGDLPFEVLDAKDVRHLPPQLSNAAKITVGAEWLHSNGIPREALES